MANLYETSVEVLGQIVGHVPAQMCMSAACVASGKSAEALTLDDFAVIAAKIRADMSPFASPDLIENALTQIREKL